MSGTDKITDRILPKCKYTTLVTLTRQLKEVLENKKKDQVNVYDGIMANYTSEVDKFKEYYTSMFIISKDIAKGVLIKEIVHEASFISKVLYKLFGYTCGLKDYTFDISTIQSKLVYVNDIKSEQFLKFKFDPRIVLDISYTFTSYRDLICNILGEKNYDFLMGILTNINNYYDQSIDARWKIKEYDKQLAIVDKFLNDFKIHLKLNSVVYYEDLVITAPEELVNIFDKVENRDVKQSF